MYNYVELSFNSAKSLSINFDLLNKNNPAWNHFLIEKIDNHRFFYIDSLIRSNIINRGKPSLIKGLILSENNKISELMDTFSGTIYKSEEMSVNILTNNSVSYDSCFHNNQLSVEFQHFIVELKISDKINNLQDLAFFTKKIDFFSLSLENQNKLKSFLNSSHNNQTTKLIIKFFENLLHVESDIAQNIVDHVYKTFRIGDGDLTYDHLILASDSLGEAEVSIQLKKFRENEKFPRLFSQNVTKTNGNSVIILNEFHYLSEFIASIFIIDVTEEASNLTNHIKILFFDRFLDANFKSADYDFLAETIRVARRRGFVTLLSERKFPKLKDKDMQTAILASMQTNIWGNLGDSAREVSDFYMMDESISIQDLKFNYGIPYHNEKNKYYSDFDLKVDFLSFFDTSNDSWSYNQAMMLTDDYSKIRKINNRFVNYIVDRVGIFNIIGDLLPNDLEHLDKEITRLKLKEFILLIPQENINEERIYQDFGYKKCKNKITFKFIGDYNEEIENLKRENWGKLTQVWDKPKKNDGKLLICCENFSLI